MTNARWLVYTLLSLAGLFLLNLTLSWYLDPFGLLRNVRGRALYASEDERQVKYLLNRNYVPENFNALIIGASGSVNWNLSLLTGYRFYNESIFGGNAAEERRLVEQALPKGHFKVALVCFHPLITEKHSLQDGLDRVSFSESLGSVVSFRIEDEMLQRRFGHLKPYYFADGSHLMQPRPPLHPDDVGTDSLPVVDPEAVKAYRSLVQELIARHVRVIYISYPLFEPHYLHTKAETDLYTQSMLKAMPPEPAIDFNSDQYIAFRSDIHNFVDEAHLSPAGSNILSTEVNARMHAILRDQ